MNGIESMASFLDAVGAKTPAPGGGAVAGAVGAQASALATMVVRYSIGRKALVAHQASLEEALERLDAFRALFERLAAEDARAYEHYRSIRSSDDRKEVDDAARACIDIPRACLGASCDLLRHLGTLPTITNEWLRSDLAIAAVLAEGASRAARWNVLVNLDLLPESERDAIRREADMLVDRARTMAANVEQSCA